MTYSSVIGPLIRKDWHINRWIIGGYSVGSVLVLLTLLTDNTTIFNSGLILILTLVIAMGATLVMGIITERSEHTLTFIMSMPISVRQYTVAKIIAHLGMFIMPWMIILSGAWLVTLLRAEVPNGLGIYATLVMMELLVNFCVLLAIALISESSTWCYAGIIVTNLLLQGFLFWLGTLPAIANLPQTDTLHWMLPMLLILGAEILAIVALLALTLYLQSRKTSFI